MEKIYILFNLILILLSIKITLEDICPDNKINIAALGKCETIEDLLFNESLPLKTENLLYLASTDERRIEKKGFKLDILKLNDSKLHSHNMRKSKLYIPNSCIEEMEKHELIKLDRSKGIVILVSDSNNLNINNIPNNYFIIRHNSADSQIKLINSKSFDFSFCNKEPILLEDEIKLEELKYNSTNDNDSINLDKVLYGRKYGIDLFDPYSNFFNDICFKFTSENNSDVTLESRVEDYYQNITFCDEKESSHYLGYNYSENKNTITYRCAFGFYKNENEKSSYLDLIDSEIKTYVSVSNLKVITCYKNFLNLRDLIKNYGGAICILVLIIQFICFLLFCFLGIKSIKKQLEDLFTLGNEIIRRQSVLKENNLTIEKENDSKDNFNNFSQEKIPKFKNKEKPVSNPPKKNDSSENKDNEIQKVNSEEENKINRQETSGNIKEETKNDNNNEENKLANERKVTTEDKDFRNKVFGNNLSSSVIKKSKVPFDKATNIDIDMKSESSQLYDYESDELNELPFDKALKKDKRNFCVYYCNILVVSHIILNVFFRQSDYNLFVVKLGLLFMTFPINLTFNSFFFTNEKIKLNYVKSIEDISTFWSNISNTVYSSILSSTFLIILKFISLTHNSIRSLRKIKNVKEAKEKSVCLLKCIKLRIFIYYILSFAFLIIFGFYVLCFCAIFENTQLILVKSTFTSWLISLIYPFIICFITSFFRSISFACESKCLYLVKQLLQML